MDFIETRNLDSFANSFSDHLVNITAMTFYRICYPVTIKRDLPWRNVRREDSCFSDMDKNAWI
jgi:hypothetical protein